MTQQNANSGDGSPLPSTLGSAYDVVIPDVVHSVSVYSRSIGFPIAIDRENWRTVLRELCDAAKSAAEMKEDLRDLAQLNEDE